MELADTPEPPYYAVIFSSISHRKDNHYQTISKRMNELVKQQPGFLGVDNAEDVMGITVSYWKDLDSIKNWKHNFEHQQAQEMGHKEFYQAYRVRIARVERDYGFERK